MDSLQCDRRIEKPLQLEVAVVVALRSVKPRLPGGVGCVLFTLKTALLPALLAHEFHDAGCRPACYKARDVVNVHPATFRYFVTGASLGAIRDFAGEHVMVLLLATEVEKMFG